MKTLLKLMFVGAMSLAPMAAQAQVEIVVGPPAAWVATAAPVYYEGRPRYWYGNRWYYREGAAWRYYNEEPVYLREYHHPYRHYYERHYVERGGGGWRHR